MSSVNMLPSAPPKSSNLYHQLPPSQAQDFRLQNISEMSNTLDRKVNHCRLVVNKNKQAKKTVNWSVAGCGRLSTALSVASLGTAACRRFAGFSLIRGPCRALRSRFFMFDCRQQEAGVRNKKA